MRSRIMIISLAASLALVSAFLYTGCEDDPMEPAHARKLLVSLRAAGGWTSLLFPRLVLRRARLHGQQADAL